MKKYTKIVVIAVLMILLLLKINQLTGVQITILILFLIIALYLFEKREVKRGFQSGIRRLYICVDFDGVNRAIFDLKRNALFSIMTKEAALTLEKLIAFYSEGKRLEHSAVKDKYYRFWADQVDFLAGMTESLSIPQELNKLLSELDRERISVSRCYEKNHIEESEKLRSEVSSSLLIAELSLLCSHVATEERLKQYYNKVAQNLSKGAFESVTLSEGDHHFYLNHQTC